MHAFAHSFLKRQWILHERQKEKRKGERKREGEDVKKQNKSEKIKDMDISSNRQTVLISDYQSSTRIGTRLIPFHFCLSILV